MSRTEVWKTWDPPSESDDLWSWQEGRCAMCGYDRERMVRDHCHMTGLVRGLLCSGCNTNEGTSFTDAWDGWRAGDNTANTVGHFEIYRNQFRATPISPESAPSYYSHVEQVAWFEMVVGKLTAGQMKWPAEAPWIETALDRKSTAEQQAREILSGIFGEIYASREPAREAAS